MNKVRIRDFLFLHVILFFYSIGGILSKLAASQDFLSFKFILFYGLVLVDLFIYAILWQQILKKMPLTTAFLNKSVIVIWGIIWGALIFSEQIKWNMFIGAAIIMIGICVVVSENGE